ncbi:MAG: biopolymer transporter ExbD [Deltaproteobacteria bacterium]|nr:biopolymer transporter ExbD [Deltaproteobacteria bacterium]
MAFKANDEGNSALSEINIIPLVDIMLIMLVIFMVAAPSLLAQNERNLDVDVPQVATDVTETDTQDRVLTIDKLGNLTLQGKGIEGAESHTLETIGVRLESAYANEPRENRVLFVRADKSVPHGVVLKIIGLSRQTGIAKIGMVTQPEKESN